MILEKTLSSRGEKNKTKYCEPSYDNFECCNKWYCIPSVKDKTKLTALAAVLVLAYQSEFEPGNRISKDNSRSSSVPLRELHSRFLPSLTHLTFHILFVISVRPLLSHTSSLNEGREETFELALRSKHKFSYFFVIKELHLVSCEENNISKYRSVMQDMIKCFRNTCSGLSAPKFCIKFNMLRLSSALLSFWNFLSIFRLPNDLDSLPLGLSSP